MAREIPLTQGKVAIVDDEDYEWLASSKWYYDGRYAIRKTERNRKEYMHRAILCPSRKNLVDHVNGDCLDNRRQNLRVASFQQNSANSKLHAHNTTGYRGVSRYERGKEKKWRATITIDGRSRSLGYYRTAIEAAQAYNNKALEVFGEFANLNEIPEEAV